ncbi:uncharacterized protein LOC124163970 [Ischnura elegans]|uniref:uncharacterized protein LOC124163970 n=1 Tax=Ischnura elegans TaxID=197161 RepID=UPI001ED8B472|nr:uncharacterized protein LOC124163970 [Ischnura elegans]
MAASAPTSMAVLCFLITLISLALAAETRMSQEPPQDSRDKRQNLQSFFGLTGAQRSGPKWPLASPPSWDAKLWDYYSPQQLQPRPYDQESDAMEELRGPLKTPLSEEALQLGYNLLRKRSPSCMSKCVNQGQIHPIMCHSLC